MSGADYGRSLTGFSVNLMVREIGPALRFAKEIVGAAIIYSDADFAAVQACGTQWMLHADHCYDKHPMLSLVNNQVPRGRGVELRLHGMDPDDAQAAAERCGYQVRPIRRMASEKFICWMTMAMYGCLIGHSSRSYDPHPRYPRRLGKVGRQANINAT